MNLLAFLSYVLVVTFTPGPNNIMSMANAGKYGFRKALGFDLGVGTGFFVIMLLSTYFNLTLYSFIPKIKGFMGAFGAAYMLYLAYKIAKSKPPKEEEHSDEKVNLYPIGIIMQFINPKAILYGITVTSSFIIPNYSSDISYVAFALGLAVIALISTVCWATFGSFFNVFLRKYNTQFNIAMALLLVYSAASISGVI